MLPFITFNGYFLARRDIVRESSSFCSTLSSAIRRLYLQSISGQLLLLIPLSYHFLTLCIFPDNSLHKIYNLSLISLTFFN